MRLAASYIRMSREHQRYSPELQRLALDAYASDHGFEIVREYLDEGISGLRFETRPALQQMLSDAISAAPGFGSILVYDVSRWGRFQDPDESAHYEFICKQAGVEVIYCAEPFDNDGSLVASLVKHMKRGMAAEYSRDLSAKTSRALQGLAAQGFWVNGQPGYGLRRVAASMEKRIHFQMESGEQKALRGYRTLLVHGPEFEVQTVRRIYSLFLVGGMKITTISNLLNSEGIPAEAGATWSGNRVRQVLTNEKYAGSFYRSQSEGGLGRRRLRARSEWLRVTDALQPIVSKARFAAVQRQMRHARSKNPTDEELLAGLRLVLRDYGRISHALIDAHPDSHCADIVRRRFGGILNALALIGVEPTRRQTAAAEKAKRDGPASFPPRQPRVDGHRALEALREHFATRGFVSSNTIDEDPGLPSSEWFRRRYGGMGRLYELLGHTPTTQQARRLGATSRLKS